MRYALVVANESLSKITNYNDRSSCILFGDGAAAALIEYKEDALYTSHLGADGTGAKFLYAHSALPQSPFVKPERLAEYDDGIGAAPEGWEHAMLQDGREVYKFATHALPVPRSPSLSMRQSVPERSSAAKRSAWSVSAQV